MKLPWQSSRDGEEACWLTEDERLKSFLILQRKHKTEISDNVEILNKEDLVCKSVMAPHSPLDGRAVGFLGRRMIDTTPIHEIEIV